MLIETNEWKVLALCSLHMLVGVLLGLYLHQYGLLWLVLTICLSALSATLQATRALRGEILRAHVALSEAVVIVHRTRGLGLTPDEFGEAVATTTLDRLSGARFHFVTVRFPQAPA